MAIEFSRGAALWLTVIPIASALPALASCGAKGSGEESDDSGMADSPAPSSTTTDASGAPTALPSASPAGEGTGVALEDYCQRFLELDACSAIAQCPDTDYAASDLQDCEQKILQSCEARFGGVAYTNGQILWDPLGAADYLRELGEALERCDTAPVAAGTRLGIGQVSVGEPCGMYPMDSMDPSIFYVCAPGLACDLLGDSVCETAASLGESCVDQICDWTNLLECDAATETCVELVIPG